MGRAVAVGLAGAGAALAGAVGFFLWVAWPTASGGHDPSGPHSTVPQDQGSVPSHDDPGSDHRPGRTFVDPWGSYELVVPAEWNLQDRRNGRHMIRADFSKGDAGFQVRVLGNVHAHTASAFAQPYVGRFVSDMEGHWGGAIRYAKPGCEPVGDLGGCRVSLEHTRPDGAAFWLGQYIWLRGAQAVVFQAGAPLASKQVVQREIDAIARTFRWLPEKP